MPQRCQLPTISQSNVVEAKPQWRLSKAVAANVEGVHGGVYGSIPSPTVGSLEWMLCDVSFKGHLSTYKFGFPKIKLFLKKNINIFHQTSRFHALSNGCIVR